MSHLNDSKDQSGIFQTNVRNRIICITGSSQNETSGGVTVSVNGKISNSDVMFYYRVPTATGIEPSFGPEAGGTRVTIFGENLGIGNRNVHVTIGGSKCSGPKVKQALTLGNVTPTKFTIVCTVGKKEKHAINGVSVKIDRSEIIIQYAFTYIADPIIHPLSPQKAFLSGGTKITVEGVQLTNAHSSRLILRYKEEIETGDCIILSGRLITCQTPEAPESVRKELLKFDNTTDPFSKNVTVEGLFYLDNINKSVKICYCPDPIINDLTDEDHAVKFEANTRRLNISGYMLTHVATKFDINVTVGVASCAIVELNMTCITCIAPKYEPRSGIPDATRSEVNVTIGNIQKMIGYVEYTEKPLGAIGSSFNTSLTLSAAGAGAALILIIATAVLLIWRRNRKTKSRLRNNVNQNSTKEEITCELRLNRIAGSSCEMNYSGVYNEPYESDHYDTIAADDIPMDRCETDNNSLNCPRQSVSEASNSNSEQSQHYLSPTNHITVEVQLEETKATNVKSEPELTGDQLYLHVINDSDHSN
ncbi:plexin-2-like [Ruditapes philippinarum]|uniref:plexin-2-like n=1 Tax=Ruditapes philippinarum TaxID=129788 RepID=UPI00295B2D01|nr:plexin-2-like [Ruditapes philippinarum]